MPISYTNNKYQGGKITIIGYSSTTECDIAAIYTADKGGTSPLHTRTGVTGVDGSGVGVDFYERPADYLVLGGAANDLYITITNWNGTTATVRITGTDKEGVAQTEDIVFTGNGTTYTTKRFKTITHTQVTGFTGTTFDYALVQGQWGHMWKMGSKIYALEEAYFYLGDASNDAWLGDEDITLILLNLPEEKNVFDGYAGKGHVRFGNYLDETEKTTQNGCDFVFDWSPWTPMGAYIGKNQAEVFLYGCTFTGDIGCTCYFKLENTNGRIWDTRFMQSVGITNVTGVIDVNNMTSTKMYFGLGICGSTATFNKIDIWDARRGLSFCALSGDSTVSNVVMRGIVDYVAQLFTTNGYDCYVIDADVDWSKGFSWYTATGTKLYRQQSFNLALSDSTGAAIEEAKVYLTDKYGNQALSDPEPGEEYALTAVGTGAIAEQIVSRGYYNDVNGNVLQDYGPHTLTIKHYDYTTYISIIDINAPVDYVLTMSDDPYITKTEAQAAVIGGTCTP